METQEELKTTLSHSRQARARKNFTTKLPRTTLKKENLNKKERTKTDIPREGGEDGTLPPHRDFKERSVVLAVAHPRASTSSYLSLQSLANSRSGLYASVAKAKVF